MAERLQAGWRISIMRWPRPSPSRAGCCSRCWPRFPPRHLSAAAARNWRSLLRPRQRLDRRHPVVQLNVRVHAQRQPDVAMPSQCLRHLGRCVRPLQIGDEGGQVALCTHGYCRDQQRAFARLFNAEPQASAWLNSEPTSPTCRGLRLGVQRANAAVDLRRFRKGTKRTAAYGAPAQNRPCAAAGDHPNRQTATCTRDEEMPHGMDVGETARSLAVRRWSRWRLGRG